MMTHFDPRSDGQKLDLKKARQDTERLMLRHVHSRYSKRLSRGHSRYDVDADWAAYWRNLANAIESSVYGGDVALYQIRPTFTSC